MGCEGMYGIWMISMACCTDRAAGMGGRRGRHFTREEEREGGNTAAKQGLSLFPTTTKRWTIQAIHFGGGKVMDRPQPQETSHKTSVLERFFCNSI